MTETGLAGVGALQGCPLVYNYNVQDHKDLCCTFSATLTPRRLLVIWQQSTPLGSRACESHFLSRSTSGTSNFPQVPRPLTCDPSISLPNCAAWPTADSAALWPWNRL